MVFAPRLPAFALVFDTGMTMVYNVYVTPERNKDEFVVLDAFRRQSIASHSIAAPGPRDGTIRLWLQTSE